MNNLTEIWRPINGYEGFYEVSNLGRVKSLKRETLNGHCIKDRILKNSIEKNRYSLVVLYKNTINKSYSVHRLVSKTFIKNPENKPCTNHINGIKTDNRVENLEWCTYSENTQHSFDTGLSNNNYKRKKVAQIKNGKVVKIWESQMKASKCLKIDNRSISGCCLMRKDYKQAGGFQWRFA